MSTGRPEGRQSPYIVISPGDLEGEARRQAVLEQLWADLDATPEPPMQPPQPSGGGGALVLLGLTVLAGVAVTRTRKKR